MFKLLPLLICMIIAFPLSGCQVAQESPSSTTVAPNTFLLTQLPDLEPFAMPKEISARYGTATYCDTLVAAADYGKLYPYVGKVLGDMWTQKLSYGLVDAQGRIVVDPVYSIVSYLPDTQTGEESAYLHLVHEVAVDDLEVQELRRESNGMISRSKHVFAKADGSWVSNAYYCDWAYFSADRITLQFVYDTMEDLYLGTGASYKLYDLAGNLLAEGAGSFSQFEEGLAVISDDQKRETENEPYHSTCHYIDTDGNIAIPGPFAQAGNFQDGQAQVAFSNQPGVYYSIDRQGNVLREVSGQAIWSGNYARYFTYMQGELMGVEDRFGNVLLPAEYDWVDLPYDMNSTIAATTNMPGVGQIHDLESGRTWDVPGFPERLFVAENNWCIVAYPDRRPYEQFSAEKVTALADSPVILGDIYTEKTRIALYKEGQGYYFDNQGYSNVYCNHIQGDYFALQYNAWDGSKQHYRTAFFDARQGKVLQVIDDWSYSYTIREGIIMLHSADALERPYRFPELTPYFAPEVEAAVKGFQNISYLTEGVFNVTAPYCRGLLKDNGEWLIRLNISSNLD